MKKAFLIFFVLVATIGACFATSGDKLTLTTSIALERPEFQIIGTYNSDVKTGPDTFTNVTSPADNGIILAIAIKQSSDSRYDKSFTLSVSATPFVNDNVSSQKTNAPEVVSGTNKVLTGASNLTVSNFKSEADGDNTKVSVDLAYAGPKVEHGALGNIAEWQFKWTNEPSLAAGEYTATVTLNYTAP